MEFDRYELDESARLATESVLMSAFGNTPYSSQVQAEFDSEVPPSEGWDLKQVFEGCRWNEIPSEFYRDSIGYPAVGLLLPNSFAYFLPAYLMASLRYPEDLMDHVLARLRPPKRPALLAKYAEPYRTWTVEQRGAVATFLRLVRDSVAPSSRKHRQITDALERFWAVDP